MKIIVIDCGASFLKGALIEQRNKEILKTCFRKSPAPNLKQESDPADFHIYLVLQNVKEMLVELSEGEAELGLCISNEMHGFILADNAGNPLTDYISWQDERALTLNKDKSYLDELKQLVNPSVVLKTGMPLKSGLPSVNAYWLKQHDFFNTHKECYFYTLGDFILRHLSGRDPFIHPSNAAASGLYNIIEKSWNSELIDALQIGNLIYPTIGSGKSAAISFGFNGTAYFALPAIGDQQAALLGAGFIKEEQLSMNIGTGAQVSVAAKTPQLSTAYQTRPYFFDMYLHTIPHIPSGRALNVFYRFVKDCICGVGGNDISDEQIWEMILTKVRSAQDSSMQVDLSFFTNAITSNTKGSISQIEENRFFVGELFKTILDQMAANFVSAASRLPYGNECITHVVFSGGLSQKIDVLRERILSLLPFTAEHSFSNNETFMGLTEYFNLDI